MTLGLQDRVALVTGASRGIGYAIAKALQEHGARVALLARDGVALKSAAETLPAPGADRVLTLVADVTDTASVRDAGQWISQRGLPIVSGNPILG